MMNNRKGSLLLSAVLLVAAPCLAQLPRGEGHTGLQPVFRSTLGNVLPGQQLPVSLVTALLDSTLEARDSTGKPYPVVSFTFGYETSNTYLNDTTGRPGSSRTYLSYHFRGDRLDSVWRKGIAEKLKPGDVLYFDRIIAEGPGKRHYLSAPLRYNVE